MGSGYVSGSNINWINVYILGIQLPERQGPNHISRLPGPGQSQDTKYRCTERVHPVYYIDVTRALGRIISLGTPVYVQECQWSMINTLTKLCIMDPFCGKYTGGCCTKGTSNGINVSITLTQLARLRLRSPASRLFSEPFIHSRRRSKRYQSCTHMSGSFLI